MKSSSWKINTSNLTWSESVLNIACVNDNEEQKFEQKVVCIWSRRKNVKLNLSFLIQGFKEISPSDDTKVFLTYV